MTWGPLQIETESYLKEDRKSVFLGCNQAFALDAGVRSPNEVIGKTDGDFIVAAQAERYRHDDVRVMESGTPKLVYGGPYDRSNGTRRWLMTSKVPMRDEDGNIIGVLRALHDITDRKRTEDALVESNERFQAIFHGSNDAILVRPLKEKGFAPFVEVNDIACKRYGYTRDEFTNLSIPDITIKPDMNNHEEPRCRKELF